MKLPYRLRQVWWAITARPLSASAETEVRRLLTPAEWKLFQRFTDNDQQHSYRVMRLLRENGYADPLLLKAALLHDIGKVRPGRVGVVARSVAVAVQAFRPDLARVWGRRPWAQATWWQRPFIIRFRHPAWGGEMAQKIDTDPQVVALIVRHQQPAAAGDEWLRQLQWADDQS